MSSTVNDLISAGPFLLEGLQINLILTGLSVLGAISLGYFLAVMRISSSRLLSFLAGTYVNAFRSIPLILVLFWFYFLVPNLLGRPVGAFYSALVAFVLFEAAYYCEIIRSGIRAVSRGQRSAAFALGLTSMQSMRFVILPQAVRNMLPVLLTQSIILFQDTSLVYVIGLKDFLTSADVIAQRDGNVVSIYCSVAVFYLVVCGLASITINAIRTRISLAR
jgi:glutamate/aspartate transport system permease protein